MNLHFKTAIETFPIAGTFTISRGPRTEVNVVTVEIGDGEHRGIGECVPYARYGETPESVVKQIEDASGQGAARLTRQTLQHAIPAGAARNAIDSAFWDLEAKRAGKRAWELPDWPGKAPSTLTTAYTISLNEPSAMAAQAKGQASRPLLKVKLGGAGDDARIRAVRAAAPDARLIVDANEAWDEACFAANLAACADADVELIEQPLPAGKDDHLLHADSPIPFCADESIHDAASMDAVLGRYGAINIKLDKTGGLTGAIQLAARAKAEGLTVMVGCMLGTSLAMAPAFLIAQDAAFVDLDAPLLLAKDRSHPLRFEGSTVFPPDAELWG